MKLLETISKEFGEGRSRTELGSGVDHVVFTATDDSNIVYKIGPRIAINYWFDDFKKNPDLFPKVYKRGRTTMKLKSEKSIITNKGQYKTFPVGTILPLEYVKLEKLNTERVEKEWDALDRMFEDIMEIDDWGFLDFLIMHMTNTPKAKANGYDNDKTLNHIATQVKKQYPGLYKIFLSYINLTDKIMNIRSGVPDLHKYNFGYDNKGKLKCLDL